MALNPPTPWLDVTPQSFVQAGSAGAAAGEAAARTALEAQSERDRIGMEAARLSNAEHIAAMETQARQEIAQQNQLRQEQELAMDAAYKQSVIGLNKQELAQSAAIAERKARDAAQGYANQQDLAKFMAGGGSLMEGLARFPVAPSVANAFRQSVAKQPGQSKIVEHEELPGYKFLWHPSGDETLVERPKGKLTPGEMANLEKYLSGLKLQKINARGNTQKINQLDAEIQKFESILGHEPTMPSNTGAPITTLPTTPTAGPSFYDQIVGSAAPSAPQSAPAPKVNFSYDPKTGEFRENKE